MFSKFATVATLVAGAASASSLVADETYRGQQVFKCDIASGDMGKDFDQLVDMHGLDVWGTK